MMILSRLRQIRRLRTHFLTGAMVAVPFVAQSAAAQDAAAQAQVDIGTAVPATTADIVVTGSRLRRPDLDAGSPVAVMSSEALQRRGTITVQDAINELPQLGITVGGKTSNTDQLNSSYGVGGDYINLRNLGTQRTLVLVNNRRFVGGDPGTSSVDLNSVPTILVDRIDVVTGAASAVYGADAVSGVVNVVLKDKYDGLLVQARTGITSRGDGQEYGLSGLLGSGFSGGRGGVVLAAEWTKSEGFLGSDRKFGQFDACNFTVAPICGSAVVAGDLIINNGRTYTFDRNNNLVLNSSLPLDQTRYQRAPTRSLSNPITRTNVAGNAHYDLVTSGDFTATAFAEASYSQSKSEVFFEDRPQFFTGSPQLFTPLDSSLNEPRVPQNNPYAQALVPIIGPIPAAGLTVQSRLTELGRSSTKIDRTMYRIAAGLRGNLPGDFTYEMYYQYGHLATRQRDLGAFSRFRLAETLNVNDNGTPLNFSDDTCANATARTQGCVPFNFLNYPTAQASPALLDYLSVESGFRAETSQNVLSGFVTGSLFELPAGKVSVVLGGEYRKEQAEIIPAASYVDLSSSVRFQSGLPKSSYDVKELFGEINVPLLHDLPFIRRLEVGGAARISDYNTVGSKVSWSVRGEWAVSRDLRFRGVYSTAIRAPNLKELYSPATAVIFLLQDPCDTVAENGTPTPPSGSRAAACTADLGARGPNFNQTQLQSASVTATSRGNANLGAETAKTYTLGAVFTPRILPRFSATIDYYNIRIDNVVSTLPIQDTVNQCYDQPTRPDLFCSLITRDATSGQIINVLNNTFNAATEKLSGLDARLNYALRMDDFGLGNGRFDLQFGWSRLFKHDFTPLSGASVDRRLGQVGDFKNRFDLSAYYSQGPLTLGWQTRIYGKALGDTTIQRTSPLWDLNQIPSVAYHDVQGSFAIADRRYMLSIGVKNLLDKQPPIITTPARTVVGLPTVAGIYDTRGRFFYTQLGLKF